MKNKIECLIIAVLIISSAVFIVCIIGLIIPRYWLTVILLIYGVYLIYRVLNPKKRYYFVTYWLPKGDRGRVFIACDKFRVRSIEEGIAQDKGAENAVIDYYRQISKEEYECQTENSNNQEHE